MLSALSRYVPCHVSALLCCHCSRPTLRLSMRFLIISCFSPLSPSVVALQALVWGYWPAFVLCSCRCRRCNSAQQGRRGHGWVSQSCYPLPTETTTHQNDTSEAENSLAGAGGQAMADSAQQQAGPLPHVSSLQPEPAQAVPRQSARDAGWSERGPPCQDALVARAPLCQRTKKISFADLR